MPPAAARTLAVLAALAVAACTSSTPGTRAPGAESFVSQPPGRGGATATGATGPASGGDAPGPSTGSPSASRTVTEADVYALSGSTLLVLNGYRGLQVVDLSDLEAPVLRARVPVAGRPVDLHLRGGVAFFCVSDRFGWYWAAGEGAARPAAGSQLWAVDVSVPSSPVALARLDVEGSVSDTRLVGDVLYVVSRRASWQDVVTPAGVAASSTTGDVVYVASFDLSVPSSPRAVARVEFPATGWDSHAHVDAERISLAQSGWGSAGETTRFTFVDISDPGGALAVGASFEAPGRIADRWGLDRDGAAGTFRAVLQNGWNGGATLRTWASPSAGAATPLGILDIVIPETLTAARFDGARVYAVTAERVDPLWVIDASDPARPVLAGHLQMPGQLEFLEPRGDRLVALGHTGEAGQPWQLAVSLVDVADPARPALLRRVLVGTGWGAVGASSDDLRKAFRVLDDEGLVLVPFQGWDAVTWSYAGGLQLVDLDVAAGTMELRGFVPHAGAISRAFPAPGRHAWLAALSDERLDLLDATDRSAPAVRAGIDLARPVVDLSVVGGRVVELCGDGWRGAAELVVTPALDPDAATPLARVALRAPSARMFQDGAVTWVMARDGAAGTAWLEAIDLTDPLQPRRRGRLAVDPAEAPYADGWGWWGSGDDAVLLGHVLAVHRGGYGYLAGAAGGGAPAVAAPWSPVDPAVVLYDLSDPDLPRRAARVELAGSAWSWGLRAAEGLLWVTHHEWTSDRWDEVRFYVDRIDATHPDAPVVLPKVNVPGMLAGVAPGGGRVYTMETAWDAAGTSAVTALHALDLTTRGTARLAASVALRGYPTGAVTGGGFAHAVLVDPSAAGEGPRLAAVDLGTLGLSPEQAVAASWAWPVRATGGKLFLSAGTSAGQSLLVYGLADPSRPSLEDAVPTQAWTWDLVVAGGVAYLPGGAYGVAVIPLRP